MGLVILRAREFDDLEHEERVTTFAPTPIIIVRSRTRRQGADR